MDPVIFRSRPSLPFLSLLLSLFLHFPPSPLEVGPFKPTRGPGERCKLPSGVQGSAPKRIRCTLKLSESLWWHFEYSQHHVLQQHHQNLALANTTEVQMTTR